MRCELPPPAAFPYNISVAVEKNATPCLGAGELSTLMRTAGWTLNVVLPWTSLLMWPPYLLGASLAPANLRTSILLRAAASTLHLRLQSDDHQVQTNLAAAKATPGGHLRRTNRRTPPLVDRARQRAGPRAHRSITGLCGSCPWPEPARW